MRQNDHQLSNMKENNKVNEGMDLSACKQILNRAIARLWAYLGSLPALALMIGVLGMGIFHLLKDDELGAQHEFYGGFWNSADESLPQGLQPLAGGAAEDGTRPASQLRFDYDEAGKLRRVVHLNAGGFLSVIPGSKVAEQRLLYDDAGRLIEKKNLDVYGLAVPDSSGVAMRAFVYDEDGRLLSRRFLDAQGRGVVPLMPGFAEERWSYDEQGRPTSIEFLDANGREIVNAAGEATLRFSYSDDGLCSYRQNEIDGRIANNSAGYAVEKQMLCNDGETQRVEWLDSDGKLCLNRQCGAAAVQSDRLKMGIASKAGTLHHCTQFLDEQGHALTPKRCISEHLMRLNADGQIEWECFNAADGMPCLNDVLGYAERVCEYGPEQQLECEYMWDECGRAAPCYQRKFTQLPEGVQVTSLNTDGSTVTEFF